MLQIAIMLLIFIVVVAVLFAILKSVVKAALFAFAILVFVFIIVGVSVSIDASQFKKNFESSKNTFLILDGDKAVEGLEIDYQSNKSIEFTKDKLDKINEYLTKNEMDKVQEDNYKVVMIEDGEDNLSAKEKFNSIFSSPVELIKKVKNGKLKTYPETNFFKVLRFIPDKIIDLFSKVKG
jgi:energy-coupling factor transporter transmembrane protein EcfT